MSSTVPAIVRVFMVGGILAILGNYLKIPTLSMLGRSYDSLTEMQQGLVDILAFLIGFVAAADILYIWRRLTAWRRFEIKEDNLRKERRRKGHEYLFRIINSPFAVRDSYRRIEKNGKVTHQIDLAPPRTWQRRSIFACRKLYDKGRLPKWAYLKAESWYTTYLARGKAKARQASWPSHAKKNP